MPEVRTVEQLASAVRKLRANYASGFGTMDLIRSMDIDPITQLRGGDWRGTDFAECDLRGADFSACRLAYCDFTNADVAGAVFYGSDLHKSTLHRALNVSLAYLSSDQRSYLDWCVAYDASSGREEARILQINKKIGAATSFDRAKKQFFAISDSGLHPDRYSAGLLVNRASDPADAWEAYDIARGAHCQLNEVFFTTLAGKMRTIGDIRGVLRLMVNEGIAPGIRIYNTLLSRAKDPAVHREVLEEMRVREIAWDKVTYAILMRRAGFEIRKGLLRGLVQNGLRAGTVELNILLQGAENEDQADEAIEIANELEIGRDTETYALLARHKARRSAFRALADDMIEDNVRFDAAFYGLAIEASKTFADGCFLFGRMTADHVTPSGRVYAQMARLAGVDAEGSGDTDANWHDLTIALIRRVGTSADILAAGIVIDGVD